MLTWYKLDLGDAIMAQPVLQRIREDWGQRFDLAGTPDCGAIFARYDMPHSTHCHVTVFFSPAAAGLAVSLRASPCPAPGKQGLELVAGNPDCPPPPTGGTDL